MGKSLISNQTKAKFLTLLNSLTSMIQLWDPGGSGRGIGGCSGWGRRDGGKRTRGFTSILLM